MKKKILALAFVAAMAFGVFASKTNAQETNAQETYCVNVTIICSETTGFFGFICAESTQKILDTAMLVAEFLCNLQRDET